MKKSKNVLEIEKKYDIKVKEKYVIIRIDWHKFSKFTKWFIKPFDTILRKVMIKTAEEVLKKFNALFTYTQSDEITIVLKEEFDWQLIYNWRILKLASLVASYTTMIFNKILNEEVKKYWKRRNKNKELYKIYLSKIWLAYFDAKVFATNNINDIVEILLSRIKDARKNYISNLAHYTVKQFTNQFKSILHWLNSKQKLKLIKEKYNVNYKKILIDDLYNWTLIYKVKKEVVWYNPIEKKNVKTTRTKIEHKYYLPMSFNELKELLLNYLNK